MKLRTNVLIILILLATILFFFKLGSFSLYDAAETTYGEFIKQIRLTGDWITMHYNGWVIFDKPPLYFWLATIATYFFGINEFAVRFWAALAGVLTVVATFFLGKYRYDERVGFYSAVIVMTAFQFLIQSRIAELDILLTLFMTCSFLFFWRGYQTGKVHYYWLFYASMGLATLTKGIIGLAIPAFTIFLYLLIRKELRSILKMQIIPGIFIFSLIALPWYITEWCLHGEKFREFALGFLFLSRFGGVVSGHPGPWYYYFIALLLGFAPWSHLLPFALIRIFQLRNEKPELFSLCYVIPVFLVFSIAKTKLPSYILPLYPSFAIMVGKLWDDFLGKEQPSLRRGMTIAHLFLGIVAALIMIGFYLVGTSNYSSQYHEQLPELLLLAGILVIGSVFSIGFYFLRKYKLSFASVPIMVFVIALVLTTRTLPIVEGYKGEKELGQKVSQVIKENELIAAYNVGNRPGVVFYNSKPVVFLENEKELLAFLKKEKGYCFTTMPELEKIKARFRVLDQKGDLAVIY